jgi:cation:H+ antiporter
MTSLENWPLHLLVLAFLGASLLITFAGVRIARIGDQLADRTGMGEAIAVPYFLEERPLCLV